MTSKESVLKREYDRGRLVAQEVQTKSPNMNGTELNAVADRIPRFAAAVARKNMLERPVGFMCKTSAGRVVKLLQPYDSDVFTAEPEELQSQFGFVWSDDPAHAKPFVALSTSPYMIGNCCTENGSVYRSTIDKNVWSPNSYTAGWEEVV